MNALLTSLLMVFTAISLWGQVEDFEFTMYFEDALVNTYSLVLGLNSQATNGIDASLGEINIVDSAYASGLDVRVTDEWYRRQSGTSASYHTKKQILELPYEVIAIDVKTTHFPVKASWDKELFSDFSIRGTLITSINPGGWWDTGSPSDMGRVILSQQDEVVFSSNVPDPYNGGYAYVENNDTIAVYWFVLGPLNIGVHTSDLPDRSEITIYPNPATHTISIEGLTNGHHFQIDVYDITGRCVKEVENVNPVNIGDLKEGIYLLKVRQDQYTTSKLVVKN